MLVTFSVLRYSKPSICVSAAKLANRLKGQIYS